MIKNFTLNETQRLLPEYSNKSLEDKHPRPSGLTLKFVFGYAAALQVSKSSHLGFIRFLNN